MQGNSGTTSGTYNFGSQFTNSEISLEVMSRVQVRGTGIQQHHMADFRRSLNLALQSLVNRGINLFQIEQGVIQLVVGQATYVMAPEIVSIADAYYNIIQSTGAGPDWSAPQADVSEPIVTNDPQIVITSSIDRWLRPFGRADYARLPNKRIQGPTINYWLDRLGPPQQSTLTVWPIPQSGYPNEAITYFALRQTQDANLENNETPDVPARFVDWLCANCALRMARKYAPEMIGQEGSGGLLDDEKEAWAWAEREDTEKSEILIRPSIYAYYNL